MLKKSKQNAQDIQTCICYKNKIMTLAVPTSTTVLATFSHNEVLLRMFYYPV